MNMKELLLGTVVIAGLSSSAYGNDKELVGVAVAVDEKEKGRQPRWALHLCALQFLELVRQFIKCLF